MKKLFLFLVVMISVSNLAFAQNEVRGVETKISKYEGPRYSAKGDCYLWFGYQFTNLNSISVSVDVELYRDDELISTKSFVLKSKEIYIWKFEHNSDFQVYYSYNTDLNRPSWETRVEKSNPGKRRYQSIKYYVRYKAYKLE